MAATIYQSKSVTEEKMNLLFSKMRKDGVTLVPTELDLCGMLGASRVVVRKLLSEKEESGEIIRKPRGRALNLQRRTNGKFLFVSGGVNMPWNPTWGKLWLALQKLAPGYNLDAGAFYFSNGNMESFQRKIMEFEDPIVFSNVPEHFDYGMIRASKAIWLDPEIMHGKGIRIGLDNREVGRLAAEELAMRGYRRPAVLTIDLFPDHEYAMYHDRIEGFRASLQSAGLDFLRDRDVYRIPYALTTPEVAPMLVKTMEKLLSAGDYDSVFAVCDNYINFLYDYLKAGRNIPEQIGLITVNSFDYAVNHEPPVNSVATGTDGIARAILRYLTEKSSGKDSGENSLRIEVTPDMHEGKTLLPRRRVPRSEQQKSPENPAELIKNSL